MDRNYVTEATIVEFGVGIMSAIDFKMDLTREADPKGDLVNIVMSVRGLSSDGASVLSIRTRMQNPRRLAYPLRHVRLPAIADWRNVIVDAAVLRECSHVRLT